MAGWEKLVRVDAQVGVGTWLKVRRLRVDVVGLIVGLVPTDGTIAQVVLLVKFPDGWVVAVVEGQVLLVAWVTLAVVGLLAALTPECPSERIPQLYKQCITIGLCSAGVCNAYSWPTGAEVCNAYSRPTGAEVCNAYCRPTRRLGMQCIL